MGVNKVVYNGETLIDTTTTTVTPETLASGVTAINASGDEIIGTMDLVDCGITYLESTDTENLINIRDLESGTYVFYGKFKPFSGSTSTLTFSSKLLVNVITRTNDTQVMVFYPVNNCVQYLNITDDTFERSNIYLNDLATTTFVTSSTVQFDKEQTLTDEQKAQARENIGLSPARLASVEIKATAWVGSDNLYSQVVTIDGITENSQIDLTPSVEQLAIFYDKSIGFVAENENGVVTVYAIGQRPENDYTIQVTITEVSV